MKTNKSNNVAIGHFFKFQQNPLFGQFIFGPVITIFRKVTGIMHF